MIACIRGGPVIKFVITGCIEGFVRTHGSVLLLQLKADVNACTFGGNSPLHLAASLGSPPLCSMLIAAGEVKHLHLRLHSLEYQRVCI